MGKRELLLAAAFVIAGIVVYRFTAPPSDPSRQGFSFSRLANEIRREMRGQRESAESREVRSIPVPASVTEIRLAIPFATVTVTGEDRQDIEADYHVRSTGYDTEEASRLVKDSFSRFTVDEAGPLVILNFSFPREGRQTPTLRLKVPSRLAFRMDGKNGTLDVSNVASVTIGTARGETTIAGIAGLVSVTQRASQVTIDGAGEVRLQTIGAADATISNVRGGTVLNLQNGELRARLLGGPLDVESRRADMRFEQLDGLRGPVRVNDAGGEVEFVGLRTETRIDGRQSEIRVVLAAAAPLVIYNDHDGRDAIDVTLAGAGAAVDAAASAGQITLDDELSGAGLSVRTTGANNEQRVEGALRGGGPAVTLRAARGNIVLRSK